MGGTCSGRNSHLGISPFDVSLIRAAELFVAPLRQELTVQLMSDAKVAGASSSSSSSAASATSSRWNFVLPASEKEKQMLKTFETTQQQLCDTHGMTREEWFWAAQKMWRKWEKSM